MRSERSIVYFEPGRSTPSESVAAFARDRGFQLHQADSVAEVSALLNRSFPACVVLDARADAAGVLELCRSMKIDAFTAIVPVVVQVPGEGSQLSADALEAGADEVVGEETSDRENRLRLDLLLRRADRDVSVHPTTRLPGTVQIERDMFDRMGQSEPFAVCYADLDHFKGVQRPLRLQQRRPGHSARLKDAPGSSAGACPGRLCRTHRGGRFYLQRACTVP